MHRLNKTFFHSLIARTRITASLFLFISFTTACSNAALDPASHITVAKGGVYAGAIDEQGKFAVVGSIHHGVSYWRLSDGERLYDWRHVQGSDATLAAADFSPEGAWALTADKNTLALWNTSTGEGLRYWQAPGEILSVQLGKDGDHALLGLSDHTAVLFDVKHGGILRTLRHNSPVRSVALDASGDLAATGSEDRTAASWDLQNDKRLTTIRHNEEVQLVVMSADGELILSVSKYDKAVVWQSRDGIVVTEMPLRAGRLKRGLRFTSARFSADKQFLLTGQTDQTITLWRMDDLDNSISWKVGERRLWKPYAATILDVAFSEKSGEFFALASNGLIYRLQLPSVEQK
jgi:FOG: WD40 repeat